ncbi:hypothetical protein P43SY_010830 [Pythium insidiosum]|uniref:Uncharacterized protein n=1 Tax=Pythium insidiosum TaxID=114742 RepID=A0AAD5M113_PYTIN|nr:hypothetical protein P43SY_010830 [Pythium insidiosum]
MMPVTRRELVLPAVRASSLSPTKTKSDKDGASPSAAPPQAPGGAGRRGVDAFLHLANTFYALRMVLVTLFSYILFVALGLYIGDKSWMVSWVTVGSINFLLIVSALPAVQLYSVEDIAQSSSGGAPLQRLTSFSILRSHAEEIETRLKPFRLRRSGVLRIGEVLVILQIFSLGLLFFTIVWLMYFFSFDLVQELLTTRQVLAFLAALCLILQTGSFDKLRA